jgi:hypothetical protein
MADAAQNAAPPAVDAALQAKLDKLTALRANGTITSDDQLQTLRSSVIMDHIKENSDGLKTHFEKAELRQAQPWRVQMERLNLEEKTFLEETVDTAVETFRDLAKNGLLTAADVMALQYYIWGTPEDTKFIYQLLLRKTNEIDRVVAHNFRVAQKIGEAFLTRYGKTISTMPWPLFPTVPGHGAGFSALNNRILTEWEVYCAANPPSYGTAGGAPMFARSQPRCTVFRNPTDGGEPFLPTVDAQGNPLEAWADGAQVAEVLADMQNRISALQRTRRQAPARDNTRDNRESYRDSYRDNRDSYRDRSYNRERGRGRGRGGHRGGEPEPATPTPATPYAPPIGSNQQPTAPQQPPAKGAPTPSRFAPDLVPPARS